MVEIKNKNRAQEISDERLKWNSHPLPSDPDSRQQAFSASQKRPLLAYVFYAIPQRFCFAELFKFAHSVNVGLTMPQTERIGLKD